MGKPVLRGTRISVELLLELLSNGWSHEEILKNYPQIGSDDILAALRYAAILLKETRVPHTAEGTSVTFLVDENLTLWGDKTASWSGSRDDFGSGSFVV